MSFDLYFCCLRGIQIDIARTQGQMSRLEYTTESRSIDGSLIQFEYSDPATGVYCLFHLSTECQIEQEGPVLPDSHVGAGLSVSINFVRPHFFALEVMPIVLSVADSLGLFLYDPQADRMHAPGTDSEILIQSWIEHNDRVTRGLAREKEPIRKPYLPREQSLYWWRYTRARESFQFRLGEDVFVPSIFPMAEGPERVKLTVPWSAEVRRRALQFSRVPLTQVFPRCDYLMLVWGKPGAELNKAIVPYSTASASLASLLQDIDGPVDGLKVLQPDKQSAASKVFDGLPKLEVGALKRLSADGFIDVAPA